MTNKCDNRAYIIWTQFQIISLERRFDNTNRVFKDRRIPYWIIKKLGEGHKVNGNSKGSYEKVIQQEKTKSARIENRGQYVAKSQEYLFELTLKEVGSKKIQTL